LRAALGTSVAARLPRTKGVIDHLGGEVPAQVAEPRPRTRHEGAGFGALRPGGVDRHMARCNRRDGHSSGRSWSLGHSLVAAWLEQVERKSHAKASQPLTFGDLPTTLAMKERDRGDMRIECSFGQTGQLRPQASPQSAYRGDRGNTMSNEDFSYDVLVVGAGSRPPRPSTSARRPKGGGRSPSPRRSTTGRSPRAAPRRRPGTPTSSAASRRSRPATRRPSSGSSAACSGSPVTRTAFPASTR
jgi:hypothetical protein